MAYNQTAMPTLQEFLFNDWVVGFAVPILIGLGFTLLADEFKEYKAARWCFWISAFWLGGKALMWSKDSPDNFFVRAVVVFIACGVVGVLLMSVLRMTDKREGHVESHDRPASPETPKPEATGRRTTFYSPPAGFTLTPPKGDVPLTFKSSSLLTQKTRTRITRDITRFRKYLVGLGIAVPLELPPISVDMSDNTGGMQTPPQLPSYRGTISIGKKVIQDPIQATTQYCDYVLQMQFERTLNNFDDVMRTFIIQKSIGNYYSWSFWNQRPALAMDIYAGGVLWAIREKFGREFTDQLVTYTLKSMLDDPMEGAAGQDFDLYFCRKLKIGDSVIDGGDKWPQIVEILKKNGRPVDQI